MVYIKKIHIEGFKKLSNIDIELNEKNNLLVGDNGSGKTTILEALDIALNHSVKNFDLSRLQLLFNIDKIKEFKSEPSISSLPSILIQIFLGGAAGNPNYEIFYGPHYENSKDVEDFGIEFKAEFDKTLGTVLYQQISEGYIPYEYYQLTTNTFGNSLYRPGISNVSFFLINASNSGLINYNSYSKMMFKSLENDMQIKLKNKFSVEFEKAMIETMGLLSAESPAFSYNVEKTALENIVEIYENDLPVSSLGQGNESIIKTQNLIKNHSKVTIIGIEEPENHLSYSSMNKMIEIIQNENVDKQLIITSHSNRIASGIGLNNVIGLSVNSNETISLRALKEETYKYFEALPSDNLLQFILSKKVILVEGPAELIYIDEFYKKIYNHYMIADSISCISVNGLSFKHFVSIASAMKIKICVITDNDKNLNKVNKFKQDLKDIYNSNNFEMFYDMDENRRTFEICLYNDNKVLIQKNLTLQQNAIYDHKYANGDKYLGRMLNDKTGTALELVKNPAVIQEMIIPDYIKNAFDFIKNEE